MQPTQDKIAAAIATLSKEDAIAFLNERVKQNNCPVCSTNSWSIVGDGDVVMAMIALSKEGVLPLPPPNVPVFSLACNHCGFVRTHALGMIAKWKLEKDARIS